MTVEEIIQEALALPYAERLRVYEALAESLATGPDARPEDLAALARARALRARFEQAR